jgi:hypothetical protein
MPPGVRPFSEADKRAAIELWKTKVPLKNIRAQLQMSERSLRKILAYAKHHPEDPIPKKSKTHQNLPWCHQGDQEEDCEEPLHHSPEPQEEHPSAGGCEHPHHSEFLQGALEAALPQDGG